MNPTLNKIFSDIEELITEASRSHTEIISESSVFLSKIGNKQLDPELMTKLNQEMTNYAIERISSIKVKYVKDLMAVGVEISKQLNKATTFSEPVVNEEDFLKDSTCAFELNIQTKERFVRTAFLLNSDKEKPILCNIKNTEFISDKDGTKNSLIKCHFSPQLFELVKGVTQRIDIKVEVPKNIESGKYSSKILIDGFENSHINLTVAVNLDGLRNESIKISKVAESKKKAILKKSITSDKPKPKKKSTIKKKAVLKKNNTPNKPKPKKKSTVKKKVSSKKKASAPRRAKVISKKK